MKMQLPPTHQSVMPYLILTDGERFISFTKEVFGASLLTKHAREGEAGIMHAEVSINGSTFMFGDATADWPVNTGGFFIYVSDADAVYAAAVANGATPIMELADKPYGRTGGVIDPTGNTWWITSLVAGK